MAGWRGVLDLPGDAHLTAYEPAARLPTHLLWPFLLLPAL